MDIKAKKISVDEQENPLLEVQGSSTSHNVGISKGLLIGKVKASA